MIGVVVPSNRPDCLTNWQKWWAPFLDRPDVRLYVVEDGPETWATIRDTLKRDAWIIPRQTDCVRMWGYLQALGDGCTTLITMDDDCSPHDPGDAISEHVRALSALVEIPGWVRTVPDLMTRGLPRGGSVVINHGLWTGIPDVSAADQLRGYRAPAPYPAETVLPPGAFFPMSGMNLAWKREWTSTLYFGLMGSHLETGEPWGYDRYGDIWAGLFAKRIADATGYRIRSGTPFVRHDRASDPAVNVVKERAAEGETQWLAHVVAGCDFGGKQYPPTSPTQCARKLADHLYAEATKRKHDYFRTFARAWHAWIDHTATWPRL